MKYSDLNKPLICMMTQSTCYQGTRKMDVKGILWHSTGVNNPNVKRYVQPDDNAADRDKLIKIIGKNPYNNDWNHIYRSAGLNAWIGKMADGSVAAVQTMPWDYRPWGCGSGSRGSCNNGWIQFEICEDSLNDKNYFNAVYKEACELTAYLCKKYNINPLGKTKYGTLDVPTILCHKDSANLKLGSNHADVYHWFNKYGKTMDDVRKDVAALLNEPAPSPVVKSKYTGEWPVLPSRGYFQLKDKSDEVKKLQKFLNWFGNYKLAVDGLYGKITRNAVIDFQSKCKIAADGLFGKVSLAAAKAYSK